MASNNEFAPQTNQVNPPSFLGYSRGFETADSATGTAFKNLGETLTDVIGIADQYNVTRSKELVQEAVDDANSRYIGTPQGKSEGLPVDAQKQFANLERMKLAAAQGKIPEAHYWGRLNMAAKQINDKFGGAYRDQIDAEFKSLTGQLPANALRHMVAEAEAKAQAATASTTKSNQSFLDAAIKQGAIQNTQLLQAAVNPATANDPIAMARIKLHVGETEAFKANTSQRIQLLTLKSKNRENINEELGTTIRGDAQRSLNDLFDTGTEYKRLVALQNAALQTKAAGGTIDPQMVDAMNALSGQLKMRGEMLKRDLTNRYSNVNGINMSAGAPDQIKSTNDLIDTAIGGVTSAITNKEFGIAALNAESVKQMQSATDNSALKTSERIRTHSSLSRLVGPNVFTEIFKETGPAAYAPYNDLYAVANTHDAMTKPLRDAAELFKNPDVSPDKAPQVNSKTLGNVGVILSTQGGIPDKAAYSTLAHNIFNQSGQEVLARVSDSTAQKKFFYQTASPNTYKNIEQVAAMGTPELIGEYKKFIVNGYHTVNREVVDRAEQFNNESRSTQIKYNKETGTFELTKKGSIDKYPPSVQSLLSLRDEVSSDGMSIIDQLNRSLLAMQALAKASSEKVENYVAPALARIGFKETPNGNEQVND